MLAETSKDLVEATAAHVLNQIYGQHPSTRQLSGTARPPGVHGTGARCRKEGWVKRWGSMDAALFELACSINLRNKQGTGHGRPFLPFLSVAEARTAIESMGIVAEQPRTALRMSR